MYSERNIVRLRTIFNQIENHPCSLQALGIAHAKKVLQHKAPLKRSQQFTEHRSTFVEGTC